MDPFESSLYPSPLSASHQGGSYTALSPKASYIIALLVEQQRLVTSAYDSSPRDLLLSWPPQILSTYGA